MYVSNAERNRELKHHGVIGMKWGVRRYQPYGQGYTPKNKGYSSKDEFKKMTKTVQEAWDKDYDNHVKLNKKKWDMVDAEMKKRTGLTYDEAWEKAVHEDSPRMDEGKLDYDDSLWKHINDVEDEVDRKIEVDDNKSRKERDSIILKASEDFVDNYMQKLGKQEITYGDLSKLGKKQYNYEHQEWDDDPVMYVLQDIFDKSDKYMWDYDDDFKLKRR